MTLTTELRRTQEQILSGIPETTATIMQRAHEALERSGIAEGVIAEGAVAPGFELPDHLGRPVRLADLLAEGPVVVSFYRGGWCPYCNLELAALQRRLPDIEAAGARLVAISPQTPDATLDTAEKHALSFPVLSDVGNAVARRFGLVFTLPEALRTIYAQLGIDIPASNGDASFELPVPATFVIGRDGRVAFAFADVDYTRRVEPDRIIEALRREE